MSTISSSILSLTQQTTALLDVFSQQKENIDAEIVNAVSASVNAAIDPLYVLTANQLTTQTLFINYINN
jgi:hypothetical protein